MVSFDPNILLIGISLILLLIIAFKILEMIMEVISVSIISAAFYFVLAKAIGLSTSLEDIGLYTVVGTSAYVFYKLASTVTATASGILGIPVSIGKGVWNVLKPLKRIERLSSRRNESNDQKSTEDSEESNNIKEVVVDKVRENEGKKEKED